MLFVGLSSDAVINKNVEITVEKLLEYLKEHSNYEEGINSINITKKYINDKTLYFLQIQSDFFWDTELYIIEEKDGRILELRKTGAAGLDRFFEFDFIEISQGIFIEAYCSSHAGNGDLVLIPIDALGKPRYTIPAIGYYAALQSKETALENNLFLGYSSDYYDTHIFANGKLSAEYLDINKDETTDIILKGILQIYDVDSAKIPELTKEYYYKQVYLYDNTNDGFLYSTEFSKVIEIRQ